MCIRILICSSINFHILLIRFIFNLFSFGMFVWELSFQQVPYVRKFNNDCVKISQHIKAGKREDVTGFNHLNDIQKWFKSIIVKGNVKNSIFYRV